MPYLIDGHNLIGQMRSLKLSDPDDEAKLVMILGRFAMRRNRRVVVVFDRGVPGQNVLSTNHVSVQFARSPSDADTKIIKQLRRLVSPREWVLVSSDRALTSVADEVGTRVIRSHEFAAILAAMDAPPPFDAERAAAHAHVPGKQLGEWFDVFGVDEDVAQAPIDLQKKPKPNPLPSRRQKKTDPRFAVQSEPEPTNNNPVPREADGRVRRSRGGPHPISSEGEPLHKPPPPVHPDEIDEWLKFFGVDDDVL